MLLYHGSNKLFDDFDFNKAETKTICLSPHIEYARDYAFLKVEKFGGTPYLYEVEEECHKNINYKDYMQNISFGDKAKLKIVNVIKL